jgi:hypothetical protein
MAATRSCSGSPLHRKLAKLSRGLLQSWVMGLYANPSRTELREVRESAGAVGCIYIVRGQWAAGDRRERRGRRRASMGGPRSRARLAHETLRGVVRSELVVDGILPRRCCPAPACCWIGWMVEREEVGIGGDCPGEGGMQDAVRWGLCILLTAHCCKR